MEFLDQMDTFDVPQFVIHLKLVNMAISPNYAI